MPKVDIDVWKCVQCGISPCFTCGYNGDMGCLADGKEAAWEKVSDQYMLYEFDKVTK